MTIFAILFALGNPAFDWSVANDHGKVESSLVESYDMRLSSGQFFFTTPSDPDIEVIIPDTIQIYGANLNKDIVIYKKDGTILMTIYKEALQ